MVEKTVLESVESFLSAIEKDGIPISFGIVFGSHARGNTHEWSDIDLLVVSPRFDRDRTREDIRSLWRRVWSIDTRIEPIPCGEKEWEEDDSRAIVEIARREGVKVEIHEAA
jgi:predicted nucleotidyltransferase